VEAVFITQLAVLAVLALVLVQPPLGLLEQLDKEMLVAQVQVIPLAVAVAALVRLVLMLPVLMAALAALEVIGSL
jgi:hypothetical protein